MYADDLTMSVSGKSITEIEEKLCEDGENVIDWCARNDTTLSLSKCNLLMASTRQKISHDPDYIPFSIVLGGCPIPCMHSTKILGVLVGNVLSWEDHIKKDVYQKIVRSLYLLQQTKDLLYSMPASFL